MSLSFTLVIICFKYVHNTNSIFGVFIQARSQLSGGGHGFGDGGKYYFLCHFNVQNKKTSLKDLGTFCNTKHNVQC